MKKLLIAMTAPMIIAGCSSMTPAERAVAELAKTSKEAEKRQVALEKENAALKQSLKQQEEANRVLKRYIEEQRK